MNINLSLQSEIPAYEQIKMQIKAQILSGGGMPDVRCGFGAMKKNAGI